MSGESLELRCPACGKRQVAPASVVASCRRCGAALESLRSVTIAARQSEAAAIAALRAGEGAQAHACAKEALRLAPSPQAERLVRLGRYLAEARRYFARR